MPNDSKVIELHIPSDLGYEKVAMESAAAVAQNMHFSPDRIEDLKTAIAEACINAIEHGNKLNDLERVLVTLKIDESKLQVDIKDTGNPFEANIEKPDIDKKITGNDKPRGWGLFLIKNLVDEVEFSSAPEGNTTSMIIYLHKKNRS
jgi:serine/threonine-protein kinase RsbW